MDLVIGIFEVGFNDKSRWIASFGGRGMVAAGIPTFGKNVRDLTVLDAFQYICLDLAYRIPDLPR